MTHHRGVPPGWYDDGTGSGALRWWDGQRWTEHRDRAPAQPASYPGFAPPGAGHPRPVGAGHHTAVPTKRRRSWAWPVTLTLVAVVVIGVFLLSLSGGSKSEWYQEGYDLGSEAAAMARLGSAPEGACDLVLIDQIEFDDRSSRMKDMKRGCVQAVEDLTGG